MQGGGIKLQITEKNFIRHLRQKEEAALEFVLRHYGGQLKAVIHRILYAYPEDAEECLYESILKIWEHIACYDETKSTFANWAAAIAKYTALDRLRKLTKLKPAVDIDQMQVEDSMQRTEDALFNEFFMELISCLKEEEKWIFIRIFWEGASVSETAAALGRKKSVLYNRISRGKKKIIASNPGFFRKEE